MIWPFNKSMDVSICSILAKNVCLSFQIFYREWHVNEDNWIWVGWLFVLFHRKSMPRAWRTPSQRPRHKKKRRSGQNRKNPAQNGQNKHHLSRRLTAMEIKKLSFWEGKAWALNRIVISDTIKPILKTDWIKLSHQTLRCNNNAQTTRGKRKIVFRVTRFETALQTMLWSRG